MMALTFKFRPGFPSRNAFTLVEMLVVVTIMGILLYLVVPVATSLQQSSNITFAGQSVADQIAVARQIAATRNKVVEVRFIAPTTWSAQATPNYTGYHAIQLWAPNASGVSVPAEGLLTLPNGVEVSSNSTLSPLLSTLVAAKTAMPAGAPPGNYVSFFVRPVGTVTVTNPPNNTDTGTAEDNANGRAPSYFFTILSAHNDAATTLPANYLTLQVNPDTGRTLLYRP